MPEAVGSLALAAVGEEAFALLPIFGIAGATTYAGVVGSAILIGGSVGLSMLLNRPQGTAGDQIGGPALPPPEASHQPLKQAIPPRMVGFGRVRLAGAYVLFEAKSGVSYDIIAFHHGPIGGIVGYYLNDDVITIDASTGVVDVQGDGRYGSSAITIKTRTGLVPETAYSEISTPLSTIWGANYRGDGLASLALICSQQSTPSAFANIYPRGLPQPSVVADCTSILDPRTSTSSVSTNPVLQAIFYLTDVDRGMGFDYGTLITPNLAALMVHADICDAQVARNDGSTEARYTSNGSFSLDSDPADVLSSILDTCDGWLSQNGDGTLSLVVGQFIAPTIALESQHIRGCSIQYDVAEEEAVNELTLEYTEPRLDYQTEPGQSWRNETDISERGKVLSQRFALPWVYSHPQARRLAKRRDAQNNAALRGTLTTTLYGIRCLGERWVQVNAPDLPDLESLTIEIRGMTVDLLNATCSINFISVDPAAIDAWNPATEEGSPPVIPQKLVFPPPPVPANLTVIDPRITIAFDNPGRSDLTFQAEFRVNGSSGAFTLGVAGLAATLVSGRFQVHIHDPSFVDFTTYEIKLRAFAPAGAGSAFSSSVVATFS